LQLIKFVPVGSSLAEAAITPVDHGLLEMKLVVSSLETQVESIQRQMEE
jgi:hypothetical protein